MKEKYIILKVSWDNTDLTDLIAKQAEFNFDIIQSIHYIYDKVLSMINPQNFVCVVLEMRWLLYILPYLLHAAGF